MTINDAIQRFFHIWRFQETHMFDMYYNNVQYFAVEYFDTKTKDTWIVWNN